MNSRRSYHSPLREEQARRTAEQILDALVELAASPDFDGLAVKQLAAHAGVSERTVYRHFPDRLALIDALAERDRQLGAWPSLGPADETWPDRLPRVLRQVFCEFDAHADETRALARLNVGTVGVTATETRLRVDQFTAHVAEAFPDLPEQDRRGVAACLQLLGSSRTWMRMVDEWGMTGAESGRYTAWLAALMMEHLRRGADIPEVEPEPVGENAPR